MACATPADNSDVGSKKINEMAARDGAMRFQITDKLGNQKDVVMLPVFDFQTTVTKISSKDAKSCQHFASFSRPQEDWLGVCDAAIADPTISAQNKTATQFNRALIQFGLGNLDTADAAFEALAQDHPTFGEPLAERAKIARLRHDYPGSITLAQEASSRGLEKPYRAHLIMGKAYEANFEFEAARRAYETAQNLAPGNTHVRKNLERLNTLWPAAHKSAARP
jgi:tetratricopeptide (TPR) repeat protein